MTQRTLVVKVGTSLLRAGDEFLQALAANLSAERQRGTRWCWSPVVPLVWAATNWASRNFNSWKSSRQQQPLAKAN